MSTIKDQNKQTILNRLCFRVDIVHS